MWFPSRDPRTEVRLDDTPEGRRLVASREIDAPAGECWKLLVDTTRWPEWGPSIRAVDCNQRSIDAGTTGRVQTVGGVWLPFEITACSATRWTWRVARIPATGHRVRGDSPSHVEFEIPLVAAGYLPICLKALQELEELLDG